MSDNLHTYVDNSLIGHTGEILLLLIWEHHRVPLDEPEEMTVDKVDWGSLDYCPCDPDK